MTLCNPPTFAVPDFDSPTTYNVLHEKVNHSFMWRISCVADVSKLKLWNKESINILFKNLVDIKYIDCRSVPNTRTSFIGNNNLLLWFYPLYFITLIFWSLNSSLFIKSTVRWWKKYLLIEGTMSSNSMFVTMSCLSYSSMLSPWKVSNDAASTS